MNERDLKKTSANNKTAWINFVSAMQKLQGSSTEEPVIDVREKQCVVDRCLKYYSKFGKRRQSGENCSKPAPATAVGTVTSAEYVYSSISIEQMRAQPAPGSPDIEDVPGTTMVPEYRSGQLLTSPNEVSHGSYLE